MALTRIEIMYTNTIIRLPPRDRAPFCPAN